MLLSELSLITQDRSYYKISCSYFDITVEVSGQEPIWPRRSILVLLESILQQFASSSWITCGKGKDRVERSARSGVSAKHMVGGISEAVEVDGVLRGRRRQHAPGEAIKVKGVVIKRRRGRSGRGDGVLRG
jgi:hypothetical protein